MVSGKGQTGYWWATDHLGNQDVDGRKILKKKQGRGSNWIAVDQDRDLWRLL
jgi:hypothetical protein